MSKGNGPWARESDLKFLKARGGLSSFVVTTGRAWTQRHADKSAEQSRRDTGAGRGGRRKASGGGAPLVAHVDVPGLLVEEAELGFLLSRLRIVRLLLALWLATNPRHG